MAVTAVGASGGGIRELRQNLSVYLRCVHRDECFEVTERGRFDGEERPPGAPTGGQRPRTASATRPGRFDGAEQPRTCDPRRARSSTRPPAGPYGRLTGT